MNCRAVDELAAALALGAVEPEELTGARRHLEQCGQPHDELRSLLGVDAVLTAALQPVAPPPALRGRLMASLAAVPQEHASAVVAPTMDARVTPAPARRPGMFDWIRRPAGAVAVAGVAATLVLAVVSASLWASVQRDAMLREAAVAIAEGPAHRVEGSAGRGFLVETAAGDALLVVADVERLDAGLLYELWLLDDAGQPVPAGTFVPGGEQLAVVRLDRDIRGFTEFAVTVEEARVDLPTGDPVMSGRLSS